MAIGDDALAAGMDLVIGTAVQASDIDEEINLTRDYIAQRTSAVTPVAKGGTGSTTAAAARAALGVTAANVGAVQDGIGTGCKITSPGFGRFRIEAPGVSAGSEINLDTTARVAKGGDTMTGDLYIPGASPASTGFVVMYHDSSGRLCRGASSERYKTDIDRAPALPDIFAVPIASYVMREDSAHSVRYGPIAEDLHANPETAGFVVYDDQGRPESFDQISYLMAAVATLAARVAELEGP